jgi:bifunctional non-homologous end joining protein LigD
VADVPGVLFVKDLPASAPLFRRMVEKKKDGGLELQIEGVMAKRRDSAYQPGVRSPDWAKIKRKDWRVGRNWTN